MGDRGRCGVVRRQPIGGPDPALSAWHADLAAHPEQHPGMGLAGLPLDGRSRLTGPTAALGALNLALLVMAAAVMIAYRALPNLRSADEAAAIASVFPVQATDALQAIGKPVRIFNYYDYGGYLLWRLYPQGSRIFIDGRVEVYGSALFSRYLRVSYLAEGWPSVIAPSDPDATVLPTGHPLTPLLQQDRAWRLFSRDGVATVFTRVGFAP